MVNSPTYGNINNELYNKQSPIFIYRIIDKEN